ncbi:methylmalonyl-CoA mutase family protein [Cecembia rubra]|uniref:methylmalonyl-CoA mutase family protein n=1 Tax=Cecembia rubra TaxID=1485585 RepID=UPI002715194F|nr:methylmalonyl-CoA mutase family protein [Cecembia rubra]
MENNLFEEFGPVTKEQWIQQAIADLKGKDFKEHLVSKTADDIEILPFYMEEDMVNLSFLKEYHNKIQPNSKIPGMPPRIWSNVVYLGIKDQNQGNAIILDALQNGCDAIVLEVSGNEDFDSILNGVELQYIKTFLMPIGLDPSMILGSFLDWFNSKNWDLNQLQGGLLWDGMAQLLRDRSDLDKISQELATSIKILESFHGFKACCINFSHYHETGATAVQELTFGIASYIELLDYIGKKKIPVQKVFESTMLHFSVGSDYFEEISKLRSSRILFQSLAALYKVEVNPEDIQVFCQTSNWTKSKRDVHTNMLRNTTEAMGAILGGCNDLWVRSHDEVIAEPNSFSRRMARNISNILREESYYDKVLDPVAGSYFIENLIAMLLNKVKEGLEKIEANGGWWQLYQSQIIQEEIKSTRKKRQTGILQVQKTKIGANKYLLKGENLGLSSMGNVEELPWQLLGCRETDLLEFQTDTLA